MKIYKDILNALKLETFYIISEDMLYMCYPLEINKNTWKISCDASMLSGNITVKIKFNGSFIYLKAEIKILEQDDYNAFIYEVSINEDEWKKDSLKCVLYQMLIDMEEQSEEWNKRKEKRYEIGIEEEKIGAIGFKSPEQTIVIDKKQLPCIINNISYGGAKITTYQAEFKKNKKVCLYLSFTKPIEQIPIIATVKNCYLKTTKDNKTVSIVSLEYENTSYEYKQRIKKYITYAEEGGKE